MVTNFVFCYFSYEDDHHFSTTTAHKIRRGLDCAGFSTHKFETRRSAKGETGHRMQWRFCDTRIWGCEGHLGRRVHIHKTVSRHQEQEQPRRTKLTMRGGYKDMRIRRGDRDGKKRVRPGFKGYTRIRCRTLYTSWQEELAVQGGEERIGRIAYISASKDDIGC